MPEVYTLRAPENFNYPNARRSSPTRMKSNRESEKHYLKPYNQQRTSTYDLLKPPSSSMSNNTKRSPATNRTHRASTTRSHSNNPSQNKITTYTVTASNDGHLPGYISRPAASRRRSNEKRQFITIDRITPHDEYEAHHSPRGMRYVPLSRSKATESIDRSMNFYRFRRS